MNLRNVLELATLISAHSPHLIESQVKIEREPLARYWSASLARVRRWRNALDRLRGLISGASYADRKAHWIDAEAILVDTLAGEVVVRVWGAVLAACDRVSGRHMALPVARSVLLAQLSVREQTLRFLVDGPHLTLKAVDRIDRLRRQIERHGDFCTGHLVRRYGLSQFAFDAERACDFGEEPLNEGWNSRQLTSWDLNLLCVRSAMEPHPLPGGIDEDLRVEVFQSILACWPACCFVGSGAFKSVAFRRLTSPGAIAEGPPARPGRLSARWPRSR